MFDELRSAFREAVDNFHAELDRDRVSGEVDELLRGMIEEVTDARTHLSRLEEAQEESRRRRAQEEAEISTCERRREMAEGIGDGETARIATEYAERHRERARVLDQKLQALEAEIALTRREVEEMTEKLKEARASRASLSAEAGRTGTRDSLRETDRLFEEFDRMEERMGTDEDRERAARELDREMTGGRQSNLHIDLDAPPERSAVDFDARLEELKRRMEESE